MQFFENCEKICKKRRRFITGGFRILNKFFVLIFCTLASPVLFVMASILSEASEVKEKEVKNKFSIGIAEICTGKTDKKCCR
jgi:hypothetical protein